jgi:hypothetical protein
MVMKRSFTLNLFYVLCSVLVLMAYPIKNCSAIVNFTNSAEQVEKIEKPVAQESSGTLHSELLFK